jgi:hypothetical protein
MKKVFIITRTYRHEYTENVCICPTEEIAQDLIQSGTIHCDDRDWLSIEEVEFVTSRQDYLDMVKNNMEAYD